jgi:MFS family permease
MSAMASAAAQPGRLARRLATPRIAYVVAAVTALLMAGVVPLAKESKLSTGVGAGFLLVLVGFVVVGLILVRQRPQNPIGWTMLVAAFFGSVTSVAGSYAVAAYRLHDHLPLPQAAVFVQPAWAPAIFFIALSIMLFPDGALPSGRWRWAMASVAAAGMVWMIGAFAIAAEAIVLNQVAIEPTGDLHQIDHPTSGWTWWPFAQDVFFVLLLCVGVVWLVSRVPAYRAATGERREQLKWLIFGGTAAVIGGTLSVALSSFSGPLGVIGSVAIIALLGIPISIGVGMTKYRLYEIDRLISRTLSYALLTGLLIGVFAGLILLTTRVLPFSSPVGVAASTLAALALFNPLRNRIQRVVDRRFNRAHYDAETTVAAFSARLRGAIDVDTVLDELAAAAGASLEPSHVSVWVKR